MKHLIYISAAFVILTAQGCEAIKEKLEKKDEKCPVVQESTVPQSALDVLYGTTYINELGDTVTNAGYSPSSVNAWFNKR